MNALVQLSIRVYTTLLRLYPTSFRRQFEEEMRDVFAEATAKAARKGLRSLTALLFREAWGWLGACFASSDATGGARQG